MASSPLTSKSRYHARSVSSPSRLHPLVPQVDDHFCRLTSSDATSSLPSRSNRLRGLEDLYDGVDDLLLLPMTQQRLAHECNEKWVEVELDGYLKLLDARAATKNIFSETKEDVKEQFSILCRKRDTSDFGGYLTSGKKTKRVIKKLLKDLNSIERKHAFLVLDKDHETVTTFCMLKEVEAVTLAVLESILSYTVGTNVQSRGSGWSLVSNLMHHNIAAVHAQEIVTSQANVMTTRTSRMYKTS